MSEPKESGHNSPDAHVGGIEISRRSLLAIAGGGSVALLAPRLSAFAGPSERAQDDLDSYAKYLSETKDILDIRTLHRSGVGVNFLDVVVVSAGFTPEKMSDFHATCQKLTKGLLSKDPWRRYRQIVNIHAVFIGDKSIKSCRLQTSGYDGGVVGCNNELAAEYAQYAANAAATIVVHNSVYSRGGTGTWGVVTINKAQAATPMVPIHELGHGLGGLGDEYIQYGDKPFDQDPKSLRNTINVTATSDPKLCKWHYWTEEEWPGLFGPSKRPQGAKVVNAEGAGWIKKIYRPEEGCFMRCNRDAFCVVCSEALETNFYRNIDLFQVAEPATDDVVLWRGEHVDVHASAIELLHQPPPWLKSHLTLYLDGAQIAASDRGDVSFQFPTATTSPGTYQLGVNLNVQSETVRRDFSFLSANRGWRVKVLPWTRPAVALPARIVVPVDGAIDVPVAVKHSEPERFELKMSFAPPGAVYTKGRFQWKPSGATGSWKIDFTAVRDDNRAAMESMEIHVSGSSNRTALAIQPLETIDAVTTKPTQFQLKAKAKDGGNVLFLPLNVPQGVELDRYTGHVSWTPSTDQAGPVRLCFAAHSGQATETMNVLVRVRRLAKPTPVSYCNNYIPKTLESLSTVSKSPVVYRRLFETMRLLRDRYEPIYQKALAEIKRLYEELDPKVQNNCIEEMYLHAWDFSDRSEILKWIREIATAQKSPDAAKTISRLDLIDKHNAGRILTP